MDKSTIQIINAVLIILIIGFVIAQFGWFKGIISKPLGVAPMIKEDISQRPEVTYRVLPVPEREGPMGDFEKMFADNPKEDVGGNIAEAWARLPEETTKDMVSNLDKEIGHLTRVLERNPENKKLKHKLKVSNMVKRLAQSGFNVDKMVEEEKKKSR